MVLIVTPARRVDEFLQETIRAVARQENASAFRHVVVMDNSDPLPEGERKPGYSIEFIRNTRSPGPAGARNTALDLAQVGEIVFFIDGDDLWPAAYLATV